MDGGDPVPGYRRSNQKDAKGSRIKIQLRAVYLYQLTMHRVINKLWISLKDSLPSKKSDLIEALNQYTKDLDSPSSFRVSKKKMRQLSKCHEHFACVCYKEEIAQLKTDLKAARTRLEKLELAAGTNPEQPARKPKRKVLGSCHAPEPRPTVG